MDTVAQLLVWKEYMERPFKRTRSKLARQVLFRLPSPSQSSVHDEVAKLTKTSAICILEMHAKRKQKRYKEEPADARARGFDAEKRKYSCLLAQVIIQAELPIVALVKTLDDPMSSWLHTFAARRGNTLKNRKFLTSVAAALSFSREERAYLGRWSMGMVSSEEYARTSRQVLPGDFDMDAHEDTEETLAEKAMLKAEEAVHGVLGDSECPSSDYLSLKADETEGNGPTAAPLDEILSKSLGVTDPCRTRPDWAIILAFEHKLRKEAMKKVLSGHTLADALDTVIRDADLKEAFYTTLTTPVALKAASVEEADFFIEQCLKACVIAADNSGYFILERPEESGQVEGEHQGSIWQWPEVVVDSEDESKTVPKESKFDSGSKQLDDAVDLTGSKQWGNAVDLTDLTEDAGEQTDNLDSELEKKFREEEELGRMKQEYGNQLWVASMAAICKPDGSVRPLYDATHSVMVRHGIKYQDKILRPGPAEIAAIVREASDTGEAPFCVSADIRAAHRLVKIGRSVWGLLCCRSSSASDAVWVKDRHIWRVERAIYWWAKLATMLGRPVGCIFHKRWFMQMIYVDDLHGVFTGAEKFLLLWVWILALR
eukprot:s1952_g16.t2